MDPPLIEVGENRRAACLLNEATARVGTRGDKHVSTLLEVSNVTKVYDEGGSNPNVALQDFSLSLPEKPARIVSIAGESGSGKSTLAGLVLGFVTPNLRRDSFSRP